MSDSRLMREQELREYLGGISHGALFQLRQQGLIPTLKIGRSVFYDRKAIDEFIDRITQAAKEESEA